jgi:hypothetical protein
MNDKGRQFGIAEIRHTAGDVLEDVCSASGHEYHEILYKRYGITDEDIAFIESKIRPMEVESE